MRRAGPVLAPCDRRRLGAAFLVGSPAALAILAILAQIAIPALHALHDTAAADHAPLHVQSHPSHAHAHHAGDVPESPRDPRHDESTCPTCQSFLSLRTFTSLSATVTPVAIGATEPVDAHAEAAPLRSRDRSLVAAPRGPPCSR